MLVLQDTNECVAGVKPEVAGDDEDEDEAGGSTQACSPEQYCENTEGSFNCHCKSPCRFKSYSLDLYIIALSTFFRVDVARSHALHGWSL